MLTSCSEYDELPVRHNEEVLNTQLARQVSLNGKNNQPFLSCPAEKVLACKARHVQHFFNTLHSLVPFI